MTINKELTIIRQALLNEHEGQDFYTLAAKEATLDEARDAFESLAAEEQKHIDWLLDLYQSIKENRMENFDPSEYQEPPSPGLHNPKVIGRESGSLAVSVFGIGINLEKAAIDFYTAAAEKTTLPAAKDLYQLLIRWETQHLEQFEQEYDQLKEEWWDKQGFSPS